MLEKWKNGDPANLLEKKEVREFPPEVRFSIDLVKNVLDSDGSLVDKPLDQVLLPTFEDAWNNGMNYGFVTKKGVVLPSYNRKPSKIMMVEATKTEEKTDVEIMGVDGARLFYDATLDHIQFGVTSFPEEENLLLVDRSGVYELKSNGSVERFVRKVAEDNTTSAPLDVGGFLANKELLKILNSHFPKK